MGREVKRIDLDFDWFEKTTGKDGHSRTWFGYILDAIPCKLCDGKGRTTKGKNCPLCYGEKQAYPRIEPPEGDGWQMWEDTSEGSPISPVFKTTLQLATWLEKNGASASGSFTATKEQWLKVIKTGGAPSGAIIGGRMMSGVEALSVK